MYTEINLVAALDRYSQEKATNADLDFIVRDCHQIAVTHIRKLVYNAGIYVTDDYIIDEAYASISRLFCPSAVNGPTILAKSWILIQKKADGDPLDATQHFINLIRVVVIQQRRSILRALYPFEGKIRRNIRQKISRSGKWRVFRRAGELLVTQNKKVSKLMSLPLEIMRPACFNTFSGEDSLPKLIDKSLEVINSYNPPYNSLRLNDLAPVVIEYLVSIYSSDYLNVSQVDMIDEEIMLALLAKPVLNEVRDRIRMTYVKTGKIDEEVGLAYSEALSAYLSDLLRSGSAGSFYTYLKDVMPELTKEQYQKNHKSYFRYLVSVMRQIISQKTNLSSVG